MVTNPTVNVLGLLAKLELGSMCSDDDESERGVVAVPRPHIRCGSDPVDAGVLPHVDQHDLAAQRLGCEWRGVDPALRLELGQPASHPCEP